MRIRRLDLLRYGHFTDRSLELPGGKSDFHIVFGPNEAGKSTALSAVEDLLFGILGQSRYGFLHEYSKMRIGAVLENDSDVLEVLRRKGNKDTLLGPEGRGRYRRSSRTIEQALRRIGRLVESRAASEAP